MTEKKKYIQLITSSFGNDAGDVVTVEHETDGELYFFDIYNRYVYTLKIEEGTGWRWSDGPPTYIPDPD